MKRFPVLLVEDNPDDVFFIERAFQSAQLAHPLHVLEDGEAAIEYLSGKGKYANRAAFPLPGLVLADLKLPRINGFELIEWMRHDLSCKLVPIVILSSSALSDDVNRAYALGANAYMVKPADHRALERLFRTIAEFWMAGEPPVRLAVV